MTRWLYVCSDLGIPLDGCKGASEHVRAITRALCEAGGEVNVLAARGNLPSGHPARQLECSIGRESRGLGDELRGWLGRVGGVAALGGEFAQMLYDARLGGHLEDERHVPPVDAVVERLSLFCGAAGDFARRRGIPYLIEMNAPLSQEAARFRDAGMESLARQVERRTLSAADVVMTVSEELRQHVVGTMGVAPERVVTVPNGVELDLFGQHHDRHEMRRKAGVPLDALVFGFVGSLKAWHGIETMLEAMRPVRGVLPHAHLLIVGDGRTREYYQARAAELGVAAAVTFHGAADHATVAQLTSAMDVGLAPYLPQDTFYFSPLKLFEYMAAGLCVIASRAGQISEVIDDGRNGMLVSAGRPAELAEAMIEVGRDASLRNRLGATARRHVACRGWDRVAATVARLARETRGGGSPCRITTPEVLHVHA